MKKARIVLFADGKIGQQILSILMDYDPTLVCGVVTTAAQDVEKIRAYRGNIFLLAWWPLVLKREILALGQDVTLNLHPSLLPHARGKDPNFWTIVEEKPFGVSIHHVAIAIDAGDIAFQREIPYTWEDTGATLYRKAEQAIVDLFRASLPRIAAFDIPRQPQDLVSGSFHRRRELDVESFIDLDQYYTGRDLLNLLRARTFEPHPGCRYEDGGELFEARVAIKALQK